MDIVQNNNAFLFISTPALIFCSSFLFPVSSLDYSVQQNKVNLKVGHILIWFFRSSIFHIIKCTSSYNESRTIDEIIKNSFKNTLNLFQNYLLIEIIFFIIKTRTNDILVYPKSLLENMQWFPYTQFYRFVAFNFKLLWRLKVISKMIIKVVFLFDTECISYLSLAIKIFEKDFKHDKCFIDIAEVYYTDIWSGLYLRTAV